MITIQSDEGELTVARGREGEALWLSAQDAAAITGFVQKPEGLCKGELCVPLPPGREASLVRGTEVNVAGLWRHLGKAVVGNARGDAWVLGEGARDRAGALQALEAPDFTLPDPSGRMHSLSEHRGKKVLLVTWASW